MEKKFTKKNIHILNDVMDAFPLMMKLKENETYVLLENDLPDSFNEKIRSDKKCNSNRQKKRKEYLKMKP